MPKITWYKMKIPDICLPKKMKPKVKKKKKITDYIPKRGIPGKIIIINGKKWGACIKCGEWRKDIGKKTKWIMCGICAMGYKLPKGIKLWIRLKDFFEKQKEAMKKLKKKS